MPGIISCDVVYPHVIIKVFEAFLKLKKIYFLKTQFYLVVNSSNILISFFIFAMYKNNDIDIEVCFTLYYHTIDYLSFLFSY